MFKQLFISLIFINIGICSSQNVKSENNNKDTLKSTKPKKVRNHTFLKQLAYEDSVNAQNRLKDGRHCGMDESVAMMKHRYDSINKFVQPIPSYEKVKVVSYEDSLKKVNENKYIKKP